jgi:hypothetical protein
MAGWTCSSVALGSTAASTTLLPAAVIWSTPQTDAGWRIEARPLPPSTCFCMEVQRPPKYPSPPRTQCRRLCNSLRPTSRPTHRGGRHSCFADCLATSSKCLTLRVRAESFDVRTKFLLAGDASAFCSPAPRRQFAFISAIARSPSAATRVLVHRVTRLNPVSTSTLHKRPLLSV